MKIAAEMVVVCYVIDRTSFWKRNYRQLKDHSSGRYGRLDLADEYRIVKILRLGRAVIRERAFGGLIKHT